MLVKQRDNEIGILLNYLNKQKASGEDASVPVESMQTSSNEINSTQYTNHTEEHKAQGQPTLFQMMNGRGGGGGNSMAANKSIKEKRMDFELNQQVAANQRNNMEGGFEKAYKDA